MKGDIVQCGYNQDTALSYAISCGTHDIVTFLLQTPNAPVNVANRHGATPLHKLGKMIKNTGYGGQSHLTEGGGSLTVYVAQLLSKGANPFKEDEDGYTPRGRFVQSAKSIAESMRDPAEALAIAERLKTAEHVLVEDINRPRLMAIMTAAHEGLGPDAPRSELDPALVHEIAASMGALLAPEAIGEMGDEQVRALTRIGSTQAATTSD
jgi:hypothetical protein